MTAPLQQSTEFARALRAYGADLVSTRPVVLQRRVGPWARIGFASRVRAADLIARPFIVNAEDDTPAQWRALGYRQVLTPAHVAEWSLAGDLRAGLHGKWRNRLVRAEASGLRLRTAIWDGTPHPLFPLAEALARARRFRPYPTALLAAYAVQNPGCALLVEARHKGALAAACLILRHGRTASYQTAWASPAHSHRQAARLVLYSAARTLQEAGVMRLDLGMVETDQAPGLARFKLGTGARLRPLGGTWMRLGPRSALAPARPMA